MDSFEWNKIAGAFLATLLFVMSLGVVSDAIFSKHALPKAGYALPGMETAQATENQEAVEPLPVLLSKADAKKGETLAKACATCHAFEKGAAAKVGPPLYEVVNRSIASATGFAYSDSLKSHSSEKWTYENLDTFIAHPKSFASGTKMAFAGEKDAKRRADIIAYLRSLSDSPAPLPAK